MYTMFLTCFEQPAKEIFIVCTIVDIVVQYFHTYFPSNFWSLKNLYDFLICSALYTAIQI